MSTNTARVNLMATALVVLALALGSLLGYFALGGKPTPTEAVVPATETVCTVCVTGGGTGSGGNVGSAPPATNGALGGALGGNTGGSGGSTR